jgi:hypothetical protein
MNVRTALVIYSSIFCQLHGKSKQGITKMAESVKYANAQRSSTRTPKLPSRVDTATNGARRMRLIHLTTMVSLRLGLLSLIELASLAQTTLQKEKEYSLKSKSPLLWCFFFVGCWEKQAQPQEEDIILPHSNKHTWLSSSGFLTTNTARHAHHSSYRPQDPRQFSWAQGILLVRKSVAFFAISSPLRKRPHSVGRNTFHCGARAEPHDRESDPS